MQPVAKPSKEIVREWLQKQVAAKVPPPDGDEIRRQLGFPMLPNNKSAECAR
ncbi:MAG: hypothetical protein WA191_07090 [Telluria sp.]